MTRYKTTCASCMAGEHEKCSDKFFLSPVRCICKEDHHSSLYEIQSILESLSVTNSDILNELISHFKQ